ncbi:MAG: Eco57I restriction-modification methylase domain-containing protein [Promethearchaeota archaeon]
MPALRDQLGLDGFVALYSDLLERTRSLVGGSAAIGADGPTGLAHAALALVLAREFIRVQTPMSRLLSGEVPAGSEGDVSRFRAMLVATGLLEDWNRLRGASTGDLGSFLDEVTLTFRENAQFYPVEAPNGGVGTGAAFTPWIFGVVYESLLDRGERGRRGVYFTPPELVQFTCRRALFHHLESKGILPSSELLGFLFTRVGVGRVSPGAGSRPVDLDATRARQLAEVLLDTSVLDPSCGVGEFLLGTATVTRDLLKRLEPWTGNLDGPFRDWLEGGLRGVDVSPWAQKLAKLRLYILYLAAGGGSRGMPQFRVSLGDFLLETPRVEVDLVVGNPPYIRHRDIADPDPSSGDHGAYRDLLLARSRERWGDRIHLKRTSDYMIYFFEAGLHVLKPGGTLAFVVSNAWLDVEYGFYFQDFLLDNIQILEFFDSASRSFPDAEVNTIVAFLRRPLEPPDGDGLVRFAKFEVPHGAVDYVGTLSLVSAVSGNGGNDQVRVRAVSQATLKERGLARRGLGCGPRRGPGSGPKRGPGRGTGSKYRGTRWGNVYFRAPDLYSELQERLGDLLLRVEDVASVERGITTGCNEFFLVRVLGEDGDCFDVVNGYGHRTRLESDYLFPILSSPRELLGPKFHPRSARYHVFLCSDPPDELPPNARAYIEWGETARVPVKKGTLKGSTVTGVNNLPSFRARKPGEWYRKAPRPNKQSTTFFQKIFDTTYKVGTSPVPVYCNNTFYLVHFRGEFAAHEPFLFASLLSTMTMLCVELNGRSNFGGGALDTATFDVGNVFLLNPGKFSAAEREKLVNLAGSLLEREFYDLEGEFGDPGREALDRAVLEMLGFEEGALARLRGGVLELARSRGRKARTFGNSRPRRQGF